MEAESEEEDDDDDDDGKKVSGDIAQSLSVGHLQPSPFVTVCFSVFCFLFFMSCLMCAVHCLFCSLRAPSFTCRWWWVFRVQCFPRTTPDKWWKVILHNFHFNRQISEALQLMWNDMGCLKSFRSKLFKLGQTGLGLPRRSRDDVTNINCPSFMKSN